MSALRVCSVWLRHNLQTFRLRLAALENKAAEEGLLLTEVQIAALERKREEQQECGEIETAHPGYLGSQDTFYVGNMKGVRADLSANLCRHEREGGLREAVHDQDGDRCGRSPQ
jgi:hypothetical protein